MRALILRKAGLTASPEALIQDKQPTTLKLTTGIFLLLTSTKLEQRESTSCLDLNFHNRDEKMGKKEVRLLRNTQGSV